jgi:DNA polymerase/3'-5' exonuclease PolX
LERSKLSPGVGAGIAKHIEELLIAGQFKEYEALKENNTRQDWRAHCCGGSGSANDKSTLEGIGNKDLDDLKSGA